MKYYLTLLMLLFSTASFGGDYQPVLVPVKLSTAYIPSGFDSNDNVQMVVEGWLSDTCYKVGPVEVHKDIQNKVIEVKQMAYRYPGICLQMIVPYHQVVSLGILEAATYDVRDGVNKASLGTLPVRITTSLGPDDYMYAPVSDANVLLRTDGTTQVVVSGVFYNSCLKLTELRPIVESSKVLTVLPIVTMSDTENCHVGQYPFRQTVKNLDLKKGRYLLNVRSMNGQAIAKLFDTFRD